MSNNPNSFVPGVGESTNKSQKQGKGLPKALLFAAPVVLLLIVGFVFLSGGDNENEVAAPVDTSDEETTSFELPENDSSEDVYAPPKNNLEVPEFETPEEEAAYYAAQEKMYEEMAANAALGTPILDENGNPVLDENGNPTYDAPEEDPDAPDYTGTQTNDPIGPPPPPEDGYPATDRVKNFLVDAPAGSEIRNESSYEEVQAMRSYRTKDCASVQKWFMDKTLANGLTIISVKDSTTDSAIGTGAWYFEATGDNIQANAYCRMVSQQAGHVDYTVGRP